MQNLIKSKDYFHATCSMHYTTFKRLCSCRLKCLNFYWIWLRPLVITTLSDKMYWVSDNPSWKLYKSYLIHGRWSFRLLVLYCKIFCFRFRRNLWPLVELVMASHLPPLWPRLFTRRRLLSTFQPSLVSREEVVELVAELRVPASGTYPFIFSDLHF